MTWHRKKTQALKGKDLVSSRENVPVWGIILSIALHLSTCCPQHLWPQWRQHLHESQGTGPAILLFYDIHSLVDHCRRGFKNHVACVAIAFGGRICKVSFWATSLKIILSQDCIPRCFSFVNRLPLKNVLLETKDLMGILSSGFNSINLHNNSIKRSFCHNYNTLFIKTITDGYFPWYWTVLWKV